ncbi:unnamed protein product [Trichogramma brassicae]|uniref:Uncharacterized protein n=1 Tax=Trichogramma brassicae TaxID=86971 RepID=A0A6H5IFT7_9HYME|nr:unnamed protein product [Trichogramma brassicae]
MSASTTIVYLVVPIILLLSTSWPFVGGTTKIKTVNIGYKVLDFLGPPKYCCAVCQEKSHLCQVYARNNGSVRDLKPSVQLNLTSLEAIRSGRLSSRSPVAHRLSHKTADDATVLFSWLRPPAADGAESSYELNHESVKFPGCTVESLKSSSFGNLGLAVSRMYSYYGRDALKFQLLIRSYRTVHFSCDVTIVKKVVHVEDYVDKV